MHRRFARSGFAELLGLVFVLSLAGCIRTTTGVTFVDGDARAFTPEERALLETVTRESVESARELLPQLPKRVQVEIRSGIQVIPETGEGGETRQPDQVLVTVDLQHEGGVRAVAAQWLRACVFHELHHLVRDALFPRATPQSLQQALGRTALRTTIYSGGASLSGAGSRVVARHSRSLTARQHRTTGQQHLTDRRAQRARLDLIAIRQDDHGPAVGGEAGEEASKPAIRPL